MTGATQPKIKNCRKISLRFFEFFTIYFSELEKTPETVIIIILLAIWFFCVNLGNRVFIALLSVSFKSNKKKKNILGEVHEQQQQQQLPHLRKMRQMPPASCATRPGNEPPFPPLFSSVSPLFGGLVPIAVPLPRRPPPQLQTKRASAISRLWHNH